MARKMKQLYEVKNELFVDLNLTLKIDPEALGIYPAHMSKERILELVMKELILLLEFPMV